MIHIVAIVVALVAMVSAYNLIKQSGVKQERARVEIQGKKTHAQAKSARKAVDVKPVPEIRADLKRFCSDCDK